MKAVVLHAPEDLRIDEVATPTAGPGEVVVRVAATGICGTDLEIYYGVLPFFKMGLLSYPWTPGHEWSGVVDHAGPGVTDFKPGDRVTGEVSIACNACEACLAGNYNLCSNRTEIGCTGRYPGAFAEYLRIPARHTIHLPDGLSLREAAMTEPAGIAMHGLDLLKPRPGQKMVVLGDGAIGLMTAQIARASGASPVVLVGSHGFKLDLARRVGIQHVVSRHEPDARDRVLTALGGKADYVVEASGNAQALNFVTGVVKPGGAMLGLGVYPVDEVTFNLNHFVTNEVQLIMSVSSMQCFPRVLRLMLDGRVQAQPLLGEEYPFEQAREAFQAVAQKRTRGVKTLVVHPGVVD
jgi:L-iditol 2-dehydrogenase